MNQVPKRMDESPGEVLAKHLDAMSPKFAGALPRHIPVERFMRVVMTAVQRNPDLLAADRQSLLIAAQQAANDGLLPDGKEGAFVVYNSKVKRRDPQTGKEVEVWIAQVQWMVMIAGLRKKVRNSGEIADWQADVVHERDLFRYTKGDAPSLIHEPYLEGDPGKLVYAYSVAWFKDGTISREVMTAADVNKVRAASKAPGSPAWKDWFDEMAKKAVARRHAKTLPMSTDLDDLIRRDDELYDFKGASDKERIAFAPPRPTRSDFERKPEPPMQAGDYPAEPAAVALGEVAARGPTNHETLPDKHPQVDERSPSGHEDPEAEFGPADAFNAGRDAHKEGRPLLSPPREWPRSEAEPKILAEAWQSGWRAADADAKAVKQ